MDGFTLADNSWLVRAYVISLGIWNAFWTGKMSYSDQKTDLCTMLRTIGGVFVLLVVCFGVIGWIGYNCTSYLLTVAAVPGFGDKVLSILMALGTIVGVIGGGIGFIVCMMWLADLASNKKSRERTSRKAQEGSPSGAGLVYMSFKHRFCPGFRIPASRKVDVRYFPRFRTWCLASFALLLLWGGSALANALRAQDHVVWKDNCTMNDQKPVLDGRLLSLGMNCGAKGSLNFKTDSMEIALALIHQQKPALACWETEDKSFGCALPEKQ